MVDRPEPRRANRRNQIRLGVAGVLTVLLIVFAFQNSERVKIDFIIFDRESRLIYIILGSAILGAIAGSLIRRSRGRAARGRERE